jgi:hypothetical protein
MVIRLFLSLLALLSGLSAAQAANPARSVQTAIGASATLAAVASAQGVVSRHKSGQHHFVEQPKLLASVLHSQLFIATLSFAAAPSTYLGDRSRQ